MYVSVCMCVYACVRARVSVSVCVCVCVCVCVNKTGLTRMWKGSPKRTWLGLPGDHYFFLSTMGRFWYQNILIICLVLNCCLWSRAWAVYTRMTGTEVFGETVSGCCCYRLWFSLVFVPDLLARAQRIETELVFLLSFITPPSSTPVPSFCPRGSGMDEARMD